jgi:hypothetical protein
MMPIVILIVLATSLGACVSADRQGEVGKDQCASQGLAPGSNAYVDCVAQHGRIVTETMAGTH